MIHTLVLVASLIVNIFAFAHMLWYRSLIKVLKANPHRSAISIVDAIDWPTYQNAPSEFYSGNCKAQVRDFNDLWIVYIVAVLETKQVFEVGFSWADHKINHIKYLRDLTDAEAAHFPDIKF